MTIAVRRRRAFLWRRILFISCVFLLAAALRNVGVSRFGDSGDAGVGDEFNLGRHLMSVETDNSSDDVSDEHLQPLNCTPPTIHEFPPDLFTNQQRKTGALAVHVCVVVYMFIALAIVCDDYFVSSLEKICERLGFSEDVAGATFMAAGSSAPELFTSVIGVFIANGDVGVGTIIGSAVFNVLIIIGICSLFAGQVVSLTWWPLFRDTTVYTISIGMLIYVIHDGKVQWYESLVMLLLYAVYIFIMWLNPKLYSKIERKSEKRRLKKAAKVKGEAKTDVELEQVTPLNPSSEAEPVMMVDEYICNSPKRLTFPDAGFRVMLSKHFPARTRMRTACWVIITERHLMQKDPDNVVYVATPATNGNMHKSHSTYSSLSRKSHGSHRSIDVEVAAENTPVVVEEGAESPFNIPDGCWNITKWIFCFPLSLAFYITVPDCRRERFHGWFMLTFFMSIMWIVIFSYIMVWMVALIGYTLRIPDTIMGITFLAAGTSVPDAMASLIVARQGLGDMAVSNCIGSNVFDILLGLALPWFIKTTFVSYGSFIKINSRGLIYSVLLLFASVTATIITIHCNKWKLDRRVGVMLMLFYAIFLTFSILVEFNVFGYVNPPICIT